MFVPSRTLLNSPPRLSIFLTMAAAAAVMTGCGGNSPSSQMQKLTGNTSVTLMLSSTANDQLQEFGLVLQGITLTSQSGKTVTLLSTSQGAEFMTLNGGAIPLLTESIPQDVYTGAAVTLGSAQFTCVTQTSDGNLAVSTYAYGQTPPANVTVTVPSAITVTGTTMGLSVDLQVAQSASYPSTCYAPGIAQYSITPTFAVTPLTFASQPTNPSNGKLSGLQGEIAAITNNSFTLTLPIVGLTCPCSQPSPLTVTANSSTVYQGIGSLSALGVGSLIEMDGALQPDGSLLATRIAAYDHAASNVMAGPLLFNAATTPVFNVLGRQQNGQTLDGEPLSMGIYTFSPGTAFLISNELSKVASLPFVASFTGSNMVAGQNIAVYSQQILISTGQYTPATTVTLMPQTINGTVTGSSNEGNFAVYTVSLANYDLFPTLAVQQGQTTLLTNPGQVQVYVDNTTQILNAQPLGVGNTLRFRGLVFNDNGTLRMDCAQVNDGVPLSPAATASSQLETAKAHIINHGGAGRVRQMIVRLH